MKAFEGSSKGKGEGKGRGSADGSVRWNRGFVTIFQMVRGASMGTPAALSMIGLQPESSAVVWHAARKATTVRNAQ